MSAKPYRPSKTYVVLDAESERGRLWESVTNRRVLDATPPTGGFYQLPREQLDEATLARIYEELAEKFGATPDDVRAEMERLGFIPLRDGPDAHLAFDMRMVL